VQPPFLDCLTVLSLLAFLAKHGKLLAQLRLPFVHFLELLVARNRRPRQQHFIHFLQLCHTSSTPTQPQP